MFYDRETQAVCSKLRSQCEHCGVECRYGTKQCDLCGAECCPQCIEEQYGYRVCRDCRE